MSKAEDPPEFRNMADSVGVAESPPTDPAFVAQHRTLVPSVYEGRT
jgi:hypothetical protein